MALGIADEDRLPAITARDGTGFVRPTENSANDGDPMGEC
jgi:hypothetical protein